MALTAGKLRVDRLSRDAWIEACRAFGDHNYRQTWEFADAGAASVGARAEHVALLDGERVAALSVVRVRKLPVVGGGLAYVSGGPMTRRDGASDPARCVEAVLALREEYAVRRGCLLRVVPPIGPAAWNDAVAEGLREAGFLPTDATPGYRTMLVAIDGEPAAIRKSLQQKWRNCLNRSEREGLRVRAARDDAAVAEFAALFDEFVVRKGFDVRQGADFFAKVQGGLPEHERFVVHLAEREGRVIAGHLGSVHGDTSVYLLGATSPEALTCKAAYLLQWAAIEHARSRGCRWYDLGGIDPEANPGVFHFKEGMGGADVRAAGPLEWGAGVRSRVTRSLEARVRAARAGDAAPRQGG